MVCLAFHNIASLAFNQFAQNASLNALWEEGFAIPIFFGLLNFWSYILAALFSVGLVRSDEEEGTLQQFLAFPLNRWEYLLARFLGGVSLVFFYYLISTLLAGNWLFSEEISFKTQLLFSLTAIPGIFIVTLCGIIFSLFFNRIVSLLFIFLWGVVESWSASVAYRVPLGEVGMVGIFNHIFYWIFPRGLIWSEQGMRLLPPLEKSLDVNWFLKLDTFV